MKRLALFVPGLVCGLVLGVVSSSGPRVARAQDGADKETQLLRVVGAMTAYNAFATAEHVGALAEGLQAKVYTAQHVRMHLGGLAGGMNSAIQELEAVRKESIPAGDKEAIGQLGAIYTKLLEEMKALDAYAQAATPENATAFKTARAGAWSTLTVALGIDGEIKEKLAPGGATLGDE